jgi:hypothetical protein
MAVREHRRTKAAALFARISFDFIIGFEEENTLTVIRSQQPAYSESETDCPRQAPFGALLCFANLIHTRRAL